jgi:hypothetical protein
MTQLFCKLSYAGADIKDHVDSVYQELSCQLRRLRLERIHSADIPTDPPQRFAKDASNGHWLWVRSSAARC